MNNREKLINRLQDVSEELKKELDHFLNGVDHEDFSDEREYDLADAFEDAANLADEYPKESRKLIKEIRQIYKDLGYVEVIDITKVVSTGKPYWWKEGGNHYQCITHWEQWINQ